MIADALLFDTGKDSFGLGGGAEVPVTVLQSNLTVRDHVILELAKAKISYSGLPQQEYELKYFIEGVFKAADALIAESEKVKK
jgi:hypothetical protein